MDIARDGRPTSLFFVVPQQSTISLWDFEGLAISCSSSMWTSSFHLQRLTSADEANSVGAVQSSRPTKVRSPSLQGHVDYCFTPLSQAQRLSIFATIKVVADTNSAGRGTYHAEKRSFKPEKNLEYVI
jgi:hypothetical protein